MQGSAPKKMTKSKRNNSNKLAHSKNNKHKKHKSSASRTVQVKVSVDDTQLDEAIKKMEYFAKLTQRAKSLVDNLTLSDTKVNLKVKF